MTLWISIQQLPGGQRCVLLSSTLMPARQLELSVSGNGSLIVAYTPVLSEWGEKTEYHGLFGVITVEGGVYLLLISKIRHFGRLADKSIYQITNVDVVSLSRAGDDAIYPLWSKYESTRGGIGEGERTRLESHPCFELAKYISGGWFYFSRDINLTVSVQRAVDQKWTDLDFDSLTTPFWWNRHLLEPIVSAIPPNDLETFGTSRVATMIMCGYCQIESMDDRQGGWASVALISRVGRYRMGTRFLARGIDDDGNVAGFVETELVIARQNMLYSMVQLRGSAPLFWEQQGIQIGQPKLQFTRNLDASYTAFESHFERLEKTYGTVHVVDLLSSRESNTESALHLSYCKLAGDRGRIRYTHFDFNTICKDSYKRVSEIAEILKRNILEYQCFIYNCQSKMVLAQQRGVFRVNCLDCLDRTNVVQSCIASYACNHVLGSQLEFVAWTVFADTFNTLWADNADRLSQIYTGTGALKSGFTRTGKRTLAGIVDDLKKTTHRFYVNHFQDKYRNKTIGLILGPKQPMSIRFEPAVPDCSIYAITWNVNALESRYVDFEWFEAPLKNLSDGPASPDVVSVSLQEIVPLSAQKVLGNDKSKRREWETWFVQGLEHVYGKQTFVVLVSTQLVGMLLMVAVRTKILQHITKVESFRKKTGASGMVGNKGSLGVLFYYGDIPICIVNSHLAAGQDNNQLRTKEWTNLYYGTNFPSGMNVADIKVVVWTGDFNYRLDLSPELVHDSIQRDQHDFLLRHDQCHRDAHSPIAESKIEFPPTYKFIPGTNIYDSQRIPGWTDRIFFQGLDPMLYSWIGHIQVSDHRPVIGLFRLRAKKQIMDGNLVDVASTDPIPTELKSGQDLIWWE